MRELHVVAVSEDGRHVLLGSTKQRASHKVRLDARLVAAVRGDLGGGTTDLSPKEIQARLRAGETAEQIARSAGVAVTRVERFAGPVAAEMARVVDGARDAYVVRGRLGRSTAPLGVAVDAAVGADATWTARREDDGRWYVQVSWAVRNRARTAAWRYDPQARSVEAVDSASAALGHQGDKPAGTARAAGTGEGAEPAATRARSAKPPAKKAPATKASAKKAPAKGAPAKKAAAKKAPVTKASAKTAPVTKASAKRAAQKATTTKATAARGTSKQAPATKAPATRAPVTAQPAKKAAAAVAKATKPAAPKRAQSATATPSTRTSPSKSPKATSKGAPARRSAGRPRLQVVPDPTPVAPPQTDRRTAADDRDGVRGRASVPAWADVLLGTTPGGDQG